MPRTRTAAPLALIAALLCPAPASARVDAPVTLDGPNADILDLGGVALASDGTGGVVFRRMDGGVPHVFVARYVGGRWLPPQRVDVGADPTFAFEAYRPRIAAGPGGRLTVAWLQEAGAQDRLYATTLPRGRGAFTPPAIVDPRAADGLTAEPSIAMNDAGGALMAYRVVTATPVTDPYNVRTGFVGGEIRLARFDGARWSRLGVPANRNRAQPLLTPQSVNAPRVAIDATGNGVVAWQEPDETQVGRIWARRVFGTRLGPTLQASPSQLGGRPLRAAADAFSLSGGTFGRTVIAYRQLAAPAAGVPQDVVMTTELPESFAADPKAFVGPVERRAGAVGPPDVGVAGAATVVATAAGSAGALLRSDSRAWATTPFDGGSADPQPRVTAGPNGRSVLAWRADAGGGRVVVQQRGDDGDAAPVPLAGPVGGPVGTLELDGSGNGDALVAFVQGQPSQRQLVAAFVDAPPAPFALDLPPDWTREPSIPVRWSPARDASGAVTYVVRVDGRAVARTRGETTRLPEGALADGPHTVEVRAVDSAGQLVDADEQPLLVDRTPPKARVSRKGRAVVVTLSDGAKGRSSGLAEGGSTIRWGDKATTEEVSGSATHTYRKPGRYRIEVRAVDAAGNVVNETLPVVASGAAKKGGKAKQKAKRKRGGKAKRDTQGGRR